MLGGNNHNWIDFSIHSSTSTKSIQKWIVDFYLEKPQK